MKISAVSSVHGKNLYLNKASFCENLISKSKQNANQKQIYFQNRNINNTNFSTQTPTQTTIPNVEKKKINKKLLIGLIAIASLTTIGIVVCKRKNANGAVDLLKKQYKELINLYPEDKQYYEKLAQGIGLKKGEEYKLSSIVGGKQLKKLLSEYDPKHFVIGENFEGLKNGTYRVNLHNHTNASDGKMTIQELLEQAKNIADYNFKIKGNDGKPPFLVGITDHGTLDNALEATRIIANNPEKYKNLKVVLGSEISVSYANKTDVVNPLNFELIGYGLNPFDEKLNTMLSKLRATRKLAKENIINLFKKNYANIDVSPEEANFFHPNLKTIRSNGVIYLTGDYLKFKTLLTKYSEKINQTIIKDGDKKLDPNKLFKMFSADYYYKLDNGGERSMSKYLQNHGFKKILMKKRILNESNQKIYDDIFTTIDAKEELGLIKKLISEALPNNSNFKDYTITPKMLFDTTREGIGEGFFGIAHPGLLNTGTQYTQSVKDSKNDWGREVVSRLFNSLKQDGKELFKASEINYQSYGRPTDDWIRYMKNQADKHSLLYAGGVDCHKNSLLKKHKNIMESEIISHNLQEIIGGINAN